jgi:hypothetical protein
MAGRDRRHPKLTPPGYPYNPVLRLELAAFTLAAAMLLVENLPQPVWLMDSGKADVREAGLQREASCVAQCRWAAVPLSRWPESVFQV